MARVAIALISGVTGMLNAKYNAKTNNELLAGNEKINQDFTSYRTAAESEANSYKNLFDEYVVERASLLAKTESLMQTFQEEEASGFFQASPEFHRNLVVLSQEIENFPQIVVPLQVAK